ncbi:UNVERIFIED_CONTAM: hypothetical protein PYX00_007192 [Menopon gallinae]|uniref:MADF domain-containing protein n=1 Tax=Menopon gallinae TaxID=328185 RepID=A0AAW2HI59_9NEOP
MKKWTSFDTMTLISEFKSMPYLWNVYHEEYKNKRLKTKAIEKLAFLFNTSPREIHRKLHNLRCQYTGEIRKIKSRTGPGERQSQWSYFNSLKFLSPVLNVRSGGGGEVVTSLTCFEPGSSDHCSGYPADAYDDPQEEGSSHETKFNPLDLEQFQKQSDTASNFSEANEKESTASEMIGLDDFDIFGKLVATHLRRMPLERAIRCQEKMFTLLMQERLQDTKEEEDT